jgi:N-methylhydantoinase B
MLWPGQFTIALDRDKYVPEGLFGGNDAQGSGLVVGPGTDTEAVFTRTSGVGVAAGTILSHRTAGGGGYGNPLERDPQAVLDDVLDEFITIEHARESYGVVIDPNSFNVDATATAKLRQTS